VGQFTALRHEVNLQTKAARTAVEQNAETLRLLAASQQQVEEEPEEDNEALRPLIKTFVDIADALTLSFRQMEKLRDAIEPLLDDLEPDEFADNEDDFEKDDLDEEEFEPLLPPEPPPRKPGFFARLFGATPPAPPTPAPPPPPPKTSARQSLEWLKPTTDRLRQLTGAAADGYAMSLRRVERSLPALDLERLVCVGEPYDPERMEVVEVVGDTGDPPGTVVEEVRPGYLWRGKLFRVAQVKVAR
jgi:molecular chaperone GrpE